MNHHPTNQEEISTISNDDDEESRRSPKRTGVVVIPSLSPVEENHGTNDAVAEIVYGGGDNHHGVDPTDQEEIATTDNDEESRTSTRCGVVIPSPSPSENGENEELLHGDDTHHHREDSHPSVCTYDYYEEPIIEPSHIVLHDQPLGTTNDDTIAQIIYDPDQQHERIIIDGEETSIDTACVIYDPIPPPTDEIGLENQPVARAIIVDLDDDNDEKKKDRKALSERKHRIILVISIIATIFVLGASIGFIFSGRDTEDLSSPNSIGITTKQPTSPSPSWISSESPSISIIPTVSLAPSSAPSEYPKIYEERGQIIHGQHFEEFSGNAIDLSEDGLTLAIGSRYHNGINDDEDIHMGSVKVFTYDIITSLWFPLGNVLYGKESNEEFGTSISLSSDGRRISIGTPYSKDFTGRVSLGQTRIYQYNNSSNWLLVGTATGTANAGLSGASIDLSSDGHIIAYGAPNEKIGAGTKAVGSVAVKSDTNSSDSDHEDEWEYLGGYIYGEEDGDQLGFSVALSSDGQTVAASAIGHNNSTGKVSVFGLSHYQEWVKIGSDLVGEMESDQFGYDISLSSEANIVAVGIPFSDKNGEDSGTVKVYRWNDTLLDWQQLGNDIHGEASGDLCGSSVALTRDGTTIGIGEIKKDGINCSGLCTMVDSGNVKIFEYNDESGSWKKIGKNIEGKYFGDEYGSSVAMSANGEVVVAGAMKGEFLGNFQDAGYVRAMGKSIIHGL